MDGGAYTQTDLRISQQRLAELVRNFGLVADGVWPVRLLTAQGPSGKRYEFEARQEPDGLYRISRLGRSEAVQVLASPACGLAMTADYDLFLVAPSIGRMAVVVSMREGIPRSDTPLSVQRIP